MVASLLESTGALLTIFTPLVAVPLTVITFYLRSLREHQLSWHSEWVRRVEAVEHSAADLRRMLAEFERDYTTKEEWLRECMLARQALAQLTETTVRMETTMSGTLPGRGRQPWAEDMEPCGIPQGRPEPDQPARRGEGNP
jgi:hypothetical protein